VQGGNFITIDRFFLHIQDLRKCHNRRLVRDTISLIATFKYDRSVTQRNKLCRRKIHTAFCLPYEKNMPIFLEKYWKWVAQSQGMTDHDK
jgi:hypothetical protein